MNADCLQVLPVGSQLRKAPKHGCPVAGTRGDSTCRLLAGAASSAWRLAAVTTSKKQPHSLQKSTYCTSSGSMVDSVSTQSPSTSPIRPTVMPEGCGSSNVRPTPPSGLPAIRASTGVCALCVPCVRGGVHVHTHELEESGGFEGRLQTRRMHRPDNVVCGFVAAVWVSLSVAKCRCVCVHGWLDPVLSANAC